MYNQIKKRNERFSKDSQRREDIINFIKEKFYWFKITNIALASSYADIYINDEGKERRFVVFTNTRSFSLEELKIDKRYSINGYERSVALVA